MKYLFYDSVQDGKAKVVLVYYNTPPLEMLEDNKHIVGEIPTKEQIIGKEPVLFCNPSTEEVWYEYEDIPKTEEELQKHKIQELENALLEISTLQAIKDIENEQAIMELTMMIGGM